MCKFKPRRGNKAREINESHHLEGIQRYQTSKDQQENESIEGELTMRFNHVIIGRPEKKKKQS